jgi:hypothetical protein
LRSGRRHVGSSPLRAAPKQEMGVEAFKMM